MPGVHWLTTDHGKIICNSFPLLCSDIIGAFTNADRKFDNYDRYEIFLEHGPGFYIDSLLIAGTSTKNMFHFV